MNIIYTCNMDEIREDMLDGGFFAGWPNAPDTPAHLKLLCGSYRAYVAIDTVSHKVVGFINAISDGVLSAYIPLLEVLPQYQGYGIGSKLVELMLAALADLYMIDIVCDKNVQPFYAKMGAVNWTASIFRNYSAQSGKV